MRLSRDRGARRRLAALGGGAIIALVTGVVLGAGGGEKESAAPAERPAMERPRPAEMPLEQAVGQTLVSSFDGTVAPVYLTRRLREGQTAGVILFGKNSASEDGLRALTRSLRRAGRRGALVMADQEGGEIRSVPFAGPEASQPGQGGAADVERTARDTAAQLRRFGVNVNLAPVADVAAPGGALAGRSFPGDPAAAGKLVAASVRGLEAGGVAATVKHFPGLAGASVNTDDGPATIEEPRSTVEERDLPPFAAGVRAGASLVMSSHALYPSLDSERIASQSPAVLGLLRDRLDFDGVVVTDSIEADASLQASGGDVGLAAERALMGGSDLVLMTGSASWKLAYPRLLSRARRSPRVRERVREAARRVLALKRSLGLRPPARTR